jgi:drug/metabolite transporter (DMT)-like permease
MSSFAGRIGTMAYGNAVLLLVATTLLWGGNTVAGRLAAGEVSPMVVVFLRWIIVAGLLVPVLWPRIRSEWPVMRGSFPAWC